MNNSRILGLDIGINSIGFALVDFGEQQISFAGVHCFDKAENPKDGSSLAKPRREKRSQRRRLRRRGARIRKLKNIFVEEGLAELKDCDSIDKLTNPWILRKELLERKAEARELLRVLIHIS